MKSMKNEIGKQNEKDLLLHKRCLKNRQTDRQKKKEKKQFRLVCICVCKLIKSIYRNGECFSGNMPKREEKKKTQHQ